MHNDIWFPVAEYSRSCLECGGRTPYGFALCDTCSTKVYRELGELLNKQEEEQNHGSNQ